MKLSKKVIVVTGGNGLIGQAILTHLVQNDAIVVNIDILPRSLIEVASYYCCDITNELEVERLIPQIINDYGKIDGLVNNAYPRTADWGNAFENVSLESWRKNVDMQLNSCFQISKLVLNHMKQNQSGSIVNVASIYGVVGNDFTIYEGTDGMSSPVAYSAIKGGLINLTRYLAAYFGPFNVRINSVSPGGVFNNQHPNFVKQFESKVPLKRMAKPVEIAPAIGFLLSDESTYITGHNLMVDGGWTIV